MAALIPFGDQDAELPEVQCSICEVVFSVVWRRDGVTEKVEFCPFCGAECWEKAT